MEASQDAVSAMQRIRQEPRDSHEESHKWQEEMRASWLMSSSQVGPSRPVQSAPMEDAQTAQLLARIDKA